MIAVLLDLLGAGFVLILTALAFPILKHYIIAWIDERRAEKVDPQTKASHLQANQAATPSPENGPTTGTGSVRISCPACQQGRLIEDRAGAICGRCSAEFSSEQLSALRAEQAATPIPAATAGPMGTDGSEEVVKGSLIGPISPQTKRIELVLDEVMIGWMETYFVPILGSLRQGPVDAYYLPNPLKPDQGEFIGYFTSFDKAHAAIEKAYLKTQGKHQHSQKQPKAQRRSFKA